MSCEKGGGVGRLTVAQLPLTSTCCYCLPLLHGSCSSSSSSTEHGRSRALTVVSAANAAATRSVRSGAREMMGRVEDSISTHSRTVTFACRHPRDLRCVCGGCRDLARFKPNWGKKKGGKTSSFSYEIRLFVQAPSHSACPSLPITDIQDRYDTRSQRQQRGLFAHAATPSRRHSPTNWPPLAGPAVPSTLANPLLVI